MKNKKLLFLTIFYIILFVGLFKYTSSQIEVTCLTTAIPILGLIFAFGSNLAMNLVARNKEKEDTN